MRLISESSIVSLHVLLYFILIRLSAWYLHTMELKEGELITYLHMTTSLYTFKKYHISITLNKSLTSLLTSICVFSNNSSDQYTVLFQQFVRKLRFSMSETGQCDVNHIVNDVYNVSLSQKNKSQRTFNISVLQAFAKAKRKKS